MIDQPTRLPSSGKRAERVNGMTRRLIKREYWDGGMGEELNYGRCLFYYSVTWVGGTDEAAKEM